MAHWAAEKTTLWMARDSIIIPAAGGAGGGGAGLGKEILTAAKNEDPFISSSIGMCC